MNKLIELSPRLRMVADLVPFNARLADIGTDHAYLPAALLMEGKIPSAVAADLRPGPLSRAKLTAEEYELGRRISFCLCNGLQGIDLKEIDAVAIAGMGGETIRDILSAAPWTRERNVPLVLQPMSTMAELREWLTTNGYVIQEERLAQEGNTIYTALLVQAGEMVSLSPAELLAGKNTRDPLRGPWLDRWLHKTELALNGLAQSKQEQAATRRTALEQVRCGLLEMRKEWETWQ